MIWPEEIAEISSGTEMKMAGKEVLAEAKLIGMDTEIVNISGLVDELSAPASFTERKILYSKSKDLGANRDFWHLIILFSCFTVIKT